MSDTLRSTERPPAPDGMPAPDGVPGPPHLVAARGPYGRVLRRLERSDTWDGAIRAVSPLAGHLVAAEPLRRFFHGDATGVRLHPILTDVPFGAWFMTQYLDLFDDEASRRAGTRLLALGTVGAVPTAVTGWAEWADSDRAARRVGMTHAVCQGLATLVFTASWVARLRGRHRLGVTLARLGSVPAIAGGFLGGHVGSGRHLA